MEVLKREDSLRDVKPRRLLVESAVWLPPEHAEERPARAVLHHVVEEIRGLERGVQRNDKRVARHCHDLALEHNALVLGSLRDVRLAHAFHRVELVRALLAHEIDLADGALAEHTQPHEVLRA